MSKTTSDTIELAQDRSVRSYDVDGHLSIAEANISKANICPYYGREIPKWQQLGLDPDRIYQLYRDPDELARAANTARGKPILIEHIGISAESHPEDKVIGSVGTDVRFEAPYLKAPLTFWKGDAIGLIETEEQRELSPGYRYDADMSPGSVETGNYDGVMRNIIFNHLALVTEGRTGPDVIVGDSKLETKPMLKPRKSPKLQAVVAALDGKLAENADVAAFEAAMDAAEAEAEKADAEDEMDETDAEDESDDDSDKDKAMDAATVNKMINAAVAKAVAKVSASPKTIAAAVAALDAKHSDITAAKNAVRAHVGEVTGAFDSADDIYALALDAAGIKHEGVTGKGLAAMVGMLSLRAEPAPVVAYDSVPRGGTDPLAELLKA